MPVIVAFFVRQFLVIGVQLGIFAAIEAFVVPLLNQAVDVVVKTFNVTEETANDILHNEILTTAEALGLTVALSKARLPLVVAERLGFTSKGFRKVKLAPAVEKKVAVPTSRLAASAAATTAELDTITQQVARSRGLSLQNVARVVGIVSAVIGVPVGFFYMIAQYMDYAAWQNPYQKTMQNVLAVFGIQPDTVMPKARTISMDMWTRVSATIEELNPISISMPFSQKNLVYSRENLVDAVNEIAANMVAAGGTPTYKNVMGALLPLIHLGTQQQTAAINTSTPVVVQTQAPGQTVKIFTGIISQGTLGTGATFIARPDDMIENAAELQDAAANNLAATLAALPSSLIYEIKIVSSVISKDGFTQHGTTQRIVSGYNKDGTPKYKTVTNKFAVLVIYLLTDRGTRTKLRQITLGPTNVATFNPSPHQLDDITTLVKSSTSTADIGDIQKIVTTQPLAVATTTDSAATIVLPDPLAAINTPTNPYPDTGYRFYSFESAGDTLVEVSPWLGNIPFGMTPITKIQAIAILEALKHNPKYTNPQDWQDKIDAINAGKYDGGSGFTMINGTPWTIKSAQELDRNKALKDQGYLQEVRVGTGTGYIPTGKTPPSDLRKSSVCAAQTLYELSVAQGTSLSTVSQRAPDYERLGLGKASLYTGTAEQNTKLLLALQKEAGC